MDLGVLRVSQDLAEAPVEKVWRERLATDDTDVYAFTPIEYEGLKVLAAMYQDNEGNT